MSVTVWLPLFVLALPFAAFLLLAAVPPIRRTGRGAGLVSIIAMAVAFLVALVVWREGFRSEVVAPR